MKSSPFASADGHEFPMLAYRRVGRRRAVADADDIAGADEQMRLAKGDATLEQLRGTGNDEERVTVLLELRPLVRVLGILDGEIVEVELPLDTQQKIAAWLEQANPDEMAVFSRPGACLFDRNIGDAVSGGIDAGSDYACFGFGLDVAGKFHRSLPKAEPSHRT